MASAKLGFETKDFEAQKSLDISTDEERSALEVKIPWDQWADSKLITDKERTLLEGYDKQSQLEDKLALLAEQGPKYASVFVKALDTIRDKTIVKKILTNIDQVLRAKPERAADFYDILSDKLNPYEIIGSILGRDPEENYYEINKASSILAQLLSYPRVEAESEAVVEYVRWLCNCLSASNVNIHARRLSMALSSLKVVLQRIDVQVVFIREGGLKAMSLVLSPEVQNTQLLYLAGFCCWVLSFTPHLAQDDSQKSVVIEGLKEGEVVKRLVDIVRLVGREKVIRISLATIRNLLDYAGDAFTEEMVGNQLYKILQTFANRKFKDDDLIRDISYLTDQLALVIKQLSSFDMYHAEVVSGRLSRTPVHNEEFFRENITKFEKDQFALVRTLSGLLDSTDELTLELACYDLGEFVRFHPDGKRLMTKFNAKQRLMILMSHPKRDVAKQALLCVQKLMVQNWEFLNKSNSANANK